jgi:hypothetical protein
MHLDDLLLTEAVNLPDMSLSDLEKEIEKMFLRNKAIQEFYNHLKAGTLTKGFVEEFADTLAEGEVEPYAWLDNTQSNVGLLLSSGTDYEI